MNIIDFYSPGLISRSRFVLEPAVCRSLLKQTINSGLHFRHLPKFCPQLWSKSLDAQLSSVACESCAHHDSIRLQLLLTELPRVLQPFKVSPPPIPQPLIFAYVMTFTLSISSIYDSKGYCTQLINILSVTLGSFKCLLSTYSIPYPSKNVYYSIF